MRPSQWRKVDREVDYLNKQYEKDGSTFRAYKTDDPLQPILVVDLANNSLPDREQYTNEIELIKAEK